MLEKQHCKRREEIHETKEVATATATTTTTKEKEKRTERRREEVIKRG